MKEIEDALFVNSGSGNRMFGTGFIVNKELEASVVEFKPVSDHLSVLRLREKYQKITFIDIIRTFTR